MYLGQSNPSYVSSDIYIYIYIRGKGPQGPGPPLVYSGRIVVVFLSDQLHCLMHKYF